MSRMNKRNRTKWYEFLVKRDGEFCQCCGALPSERELVIDHKDNDNSNDDPENFQLLCRRCNYIKNPREPVDKRVSVRETPEIPTEIEINRTKEPRFKKYLDRLFSKYEILSIKEIINSSAQVLELSPVTTRRYLEKECSLEGMYEMIEDGKKFMVKQKARKMPLSKNSDFEANFDV